MGPSGYFFFVGILASCSSPQFFIPFGEINIGLALKPKARGFVKRKLRGSPLGQALPESVLSSTCVTHVKTSPEMCVLAPQTICPGGAPGGLPTWRSQITWAEGKGLGSAWITDVGCQNSQEFTNFYRLKGEVSCFFLLMLKFMNFNLPHLIFVLPLEHQAWLWSKMVSLLFIDSSFSCLFSWPSFYLTSSLIAPVRNMF